MPTVSPHPDAVSAVDPDCGADPARPTARRGRLPAHRLPPRPGLHPMPTRAAGEPGLHPEIPEKIHKAFKLVYNACEYAIQKNEGTIQALVEHAVNQQISESAYHRLLVSKGVFTPEEYQRVLVATTELLGGLKSGTA